MRFNKLLSNLDYFYYILIVFLFISTVFLLHFSSSSGQISGISKKSSLVNVEIFIGDHRFTLFGYTSPHALVTFSGLGIFDQTRSNADGYFIFNNRFSPFSPREACLIAQDQMGRLTSEVCLPPFPTNYDIKIGPVIMPSTVSLNKQNYWVGDEIILSGQTIPNSEVNLSFFSEKTSISTIDAILERFFPIKKTLALSLPPLITKSDQKGNFAIALPSSFPQKYRLFTQTNYSEKNSPESRKLTIEILPWWMIVFKIIGLFILLIKSRLLEIIILVEIVALLLYLYHRYLHPKQLAIVKWEKKEMMLIDTQ